MYSSTAYLYQQIQSVLMIDTSGDYFDKRWQPVYAKKLKLNLGVDNVILFQFHNQDQKPVNITGAQFVFRMISQNGQELLYENQLEVLNASTGRTKITIPSEDTLLWQEQSASWSIEVQSGTLSQAVFLDSSAGARGHIELENSVLPQFVASRELNIPSQSPDGTEYYTSTINRDGRSQTTFQINSGNFTGTVSVQGATPASSANTIEWYDLDFVDMSSGTSVSTVDLSDTVVTTAINVLGYHPNLRLVFNVISGEISTILYR